MENPLRKDKTLIIILILMLLGFIIRIYSLSTQSLWIDEGFSINAALAVLKHGIPLMDSGIYYTGTLLHTYIISLFMLVFSNDIFGARLVSVLFGTAVIPLTYYLGKKINKTTGIVACILVAFSVWEIAWSRQARMYVLFQFLFLLSIYLFYNFTKNSKIKDLVYSLISAFLAILSHRLGFVLILIYFLYVIFNKIDNKYIQDSLKEDKKIIILILLLIPVIYIAIDSFISFNFLLVNYLPAYIYYMKTVNPSFFYLGIIGTFLLLKDDFRLGYLFFLSLLIPFIFVSLFVYVIHYRYLFIIFPLLFILTGKTIDYVSSIFKKFKIPVLVILLLGILINGFIFIPQSYYDLERETPQPNFDKAYSYVRTHTDNDTTIVDAFPSIGQLYLEKIDYSFRFSLSGREGDIWDKNADWYTNITYIDLDTLKNLSQCYIIIDKLSYRRINSDLRKQLDSMNIIEKASENKNIWSGITVYTC